MIKSNLHSIRPCENNGKILPGWGGSYLHTRFHCVNNLPFGPPLVTKLLDWAMGGGGGWTETGVSLNKEAVGSFYERRKPM